MPQALICSSDTLCKDGKHNFPDFNKRVNKMTRAGWTDAPAYRDIGNNVACFWVGALLLLGFLTEHNLGDKF